MQRQDEAITAYQGLIDKGTPRPEVYGNIARLLRGKGLPQQAIKILDDAAQKFPTNAHIFLERVKYFRLSGDIPASDTALAKAP